MNKKQSISILTIISIFTVLTTSGCMMPGVETKASQGIVIENFEVDFPRVYAGEIFKLKMKIRNDGYVDAYNVYPKLYNIGTSFQSGEAEISCEETCNQGVHLSAKDPSMGTTGESRTCIWDCEAPRGIPKGLSVKFSPNVRLYYWYSTHTVKSVTVVSQDELRSIQSEGKSLPSETVSTTGGPIQLDVVVKGPIRYWEGADRITFPININIQNTGGGITCITDEINVPILTDANAPSFDYTTIIQGCENTDNWNKVKWYFDDEHGLIDLDCTPSGNNQRVAELWKGQSTTLTCEVNMQIPSGHVAGIIQKNLKLSVYYAYMLDRTINVEVLRRDI